MAGDFRSVELGTCWKVCHVAVALVLWEGELLALCSFKRIRRDEASGEGSMQQGGRTKGRSRNTAGPSKAFRGRDSCLDGCSASEVSGHVISSSQSQLRWWSTVSLGRTNQYGSCCGVAFTPTKDSLLNCRLQNLVASRCRRCSSSRGIARLMRCDAQAPEPFGQVQIVASCGERGTVGLRQSVTRCK